jgi:hypothetical protein
MIWMLPATELVEGIRQAVAGSPCQSRAGAGNAGNVLCGLGIFVGGDLDVRVLHAAEARLVRTDIDSLEEGDGVGAGDDVLSRRQLGERGSDGRQEIAAVVGRHIVGIPCHLVVGAQHRELVPGGDQIPVLGSVTGVGLQVGHQG